MHRHFPACTPVISRQMPLNRRRLSAAATIPFGYILSPLCGIRPLPMLMITLLQPARRPCLSTIWRRRALSRLFSSIHRADVWLADESRAGA